MAGLAVRRGEHRPGHTPPQAKESQGSSGRPPPIPYKLHLLRLVRANFVNGQLSERPEDEDQHEVDFAGSDVIPPGSKDPSSRVDRLQMLIIANAAIAASI
jgi:hypothetical protein